MAQNTGRGFAGMDSDRQREIASSGGRAAHQGGNGHDSRQSAEGEHGGVGAAARHHSKAAFHHDTAAHHHRQAGQHRAGGRHQEADLHSEAARNHEDDARHHGGEARRHARGSVGSDPQSEVRGEAGQGSQGGRSPQGSDRRDEGSSGNDRPRNQRGEFEAPDSASRGDFDDERARAGRGRRDHES